MFSPNKKKQKKSQSQSQVKLEISQNQQTQKKDTALWKQNIKRFSILDDLDQLQFYQDSKQKTKNQTMIEHEIQQNINPNQNKQQQFHQKKKNSYSDELMRKTLQLTYQYNQTGERILKLNLSDRQQIIYPSKQSNKKKSQQKNISAFQNVAQTVNGFGKQKVQIQPLYEKIQNKKNMNNINYKNNKNNGHTSKQTSCQTVIIKNPRMYKIIRQVNILNEPQVKEYCEDFSHQLYPHYSSKVKQNLECNLFSNAIQTQRLKIKQSFGAYFKKTKN